MPIYNVKLYYSGDRSYDIEAKDEDQAQERALEKLSEDVFEVDNIDDTEIELSDNQYTDQQELQDEEDRYERKEK